MINIESKNLIKSASYLSFGLANFILLIKIYAWIITDSQSILASLIDSGLDIASSFINLIAVRIALQPPDYKHRFGHEKVQDLAVFSQSIFFLASGLFTLFSSFKAFINQSLPSNINYGVNIMYVCIVLTCILVLYQNYVIKKTGSSIIKVDKLHYITDLLTNIGVIISITLSASFWFIDSLCGVFISIYILITSCKIFKKVLKNLIDQELAESERKQILSIISGFKEVMGVHDMKTRYAANKVFIQCHIEMDGNISLYKSHLLTEKITEALLQRFSGADVIIHQDPFGYEEKVDYRENIN